VNFTDFTVSGFAFRFRHNGSYTLRYRLRDKSTPVRLMTDHCHKEIACGSQTAVERHLT